MKLSLAGLPGMSVPAGQSADGLPIGVQLLAPHYEEQKLFNAGSAIEEAAGLLEILPDGI